MLLSVISFLTFSFDFFKLSKQFQSRGIRDDYSKKRPATRHLDEEEDDVDDVRGLIRKMFRFVFVPAIHQNCSSFLSFKIVKCLWDSHLMVQ